VIILSHDGFNEAPNWASIIVVPCSTSGTQRRRGPTAVFLLREAAGLKEESVAVCHQITTLDRSKLTHRIGALPESLLREVEAAIRSAIDPGRDS
jgi:mRNA interferase MazF